MKKYAWALYGAILLLLSIVGVIYTFTAGKGAVAALVSLVFSLAYLVGLYGYVKNKAILTRKKWRILFYVNIFGLSMSLLSFLLAPKLDLAIDFIFKVIVSIPLLFSLYRYSSLNNEIWNNTELANKANFLAKAFEISSKISTKSFGMGTNILITLESNKDEFSANIEKGNGEDIQRFSNSFSDIEALVDFIESNTSADIYEFESVA